jgi:PEP-CTERM motif-containing protein
VTFDDAGAALGPLPATGTFAPVGSLADFIGEGALGTWSLFIGDTTSQDPLVFHDYLLEITVRDLVPGDVPEPASGAALLAGLAALWAGRRRRDA